MVWWALVAIIRVSVVLWWFIFLCVSLGFASVMGFTTRCSVTAVDVYAVVLW